MKKVIANLICVCILGLSVNAFAAGKEISYENYRYTKDGVLTYVDDGEKLDVNFVVLPGEIEGTTITRVADGILSDSSYYDFAIVEEPVEIIGNSAFENSSIGGIILPYTINYIGDRAFANCSLLEQVDFNTTDEIELGEDCFAGTDFIRFTAHCSSDFDKLYAMLEEAKGDSNFIIEQTHSFSDEYTDTTQCIACGAYLDGSYPDENYPDGSYPPDISVEAPIFIDVPQDIWYYNYVKIANYFGIINGKGEGRFDPDASMTIGEAVKIAACIHMLETGSEEYFPEAYPWYKPYEDYCYAYNIIEEHIKFDMEKNATRAEMAYLFSRADVEIQEINPDVPLTDIPDIYEITRFSKEILGLYRRGIAAGSDENYTFYPDSDVKRCEAAAFIARIVNPSMRIELPKG